MEKHNGTAGRIVTFIYTVQYGYLCTVLPQKVIMLSMLYHLEAWSNNLEEREKVQGDSIKVLFNLLTWKPKWELLNEFEM